MEIVEPRSATPYMGVLQSWATVDMAYMHGEGISVLFPSLVFSKRIVVNPAWMKMDGTLPPPLVPVVEILKAKGYRVYLNHRDVPPSACANGVDVSFFPNTERGLEDGMAFSLAFNDVDVMEAVNSSISRTTPYIRWKLGGFMRGLFSPGRAYYSDEGGPHADEQWTYNAADAEEPYTLEEIQVESRARVPRV